MRDSVYQGSETQVAAFARMANGDLEPRRVITGQASKLGRTIHGIAYDPVHDEIVVPNALADAILVFRAGADGAEPPIRVIQGPRTKLVTPHAVSVESEKQGNLGRQSDRKEYFTHFPGMPREMWRRFG